jgi:hypothetical protein
MAIRFRVLPCDLLRRRPSMIRSLFFSAARRSSEALATKIDRPSGSDAHAPTNVRHSDDRSMMVSGITDCQSDKYPFATE